jgi:hypothetical protein
VQFPEHGIWECISTEVEQLLLISHVYCHVQFLGHPVHSKFLKCEDEMAGLFIVVSVLLWSQRCHSRNTIECHVTFISHLHASSKWNFRMVPDGS